MIPEFKKEETGLDIHIKRDWDQKREKQPESLRKKDLSSLAQVAALKIALADRLKQLLAFQETLQQSKALLESMEAEAQRDLLKNLQQLRFLMTQTESQKLLRYLSGQAGAEEKLRALFDDLLKQISHLYAAIHVLQSRIEVLDERGTEIRIAVQAAHDDLVSILADINPHYAEALRDNSYADILEREWESNPDLSKMDNTSIREYICGIQKEIIERVSSEQFSADSIEGGNTGLSVAIEELERHQEKCSSSCEEYNSITKDIFDLSQEKVSLVDEISLLEDKLSALSKQLPAGEQLRQQNNADRSGPGF